MSDDYIKEGDLVLIKTGKHINECRVIDFSPSGEYLKVGDSLGRHAFWTPTHTLVEILESSNPPDTEYIDIDEIHTTRAQDILNKIRNRAKEFDMDEPIESEIIQIDRFAQLDLRNKRK